MTKLCDALSARGFSYTRNAPMAQWTTLKVGGPAECLMEAHSEEEVALALAAARKALAPVQIVGNGSNLLVRDGGIKGLVLVIGKGMARIERHHDTLLAEAGASLSAAARFAQAEGLSGLEALSGIPGTVGGAAYMNAGAYGAEMSGVVESVRAVDQEGNFRTLSKTELSFGYRESALMRLGLIVTQVSFALTKGEPTEIGAAMREYAAQRREKQPLTLPSAGSFFKRPEGHFAGALIEKAGLKGVSVGGAQVSTLHAGFLVNTGGAIAKDFLALMDLVQKRVYECSGVSLEPEVRILGCNSLY